MEERLNRDSAVKEYMVLADEARQQANFGPLCCSAPQAPPFSLEEALSWARVRREEEEKGTDQWVLDLMDAHLLSVV